jgi:hypothetical protein
MLFLLLLVVWLAKYWNPLLLIWLLLLL